jgi:hypothetical protein
MNRYVQRNMTLLGASVLTSVGDLEIIPPDPDPTLLNDLLYGNYPGVKIYISKKYRGYTL